MSPRLRYLSTSLALLAVGVGYALTQTWPDRPSPRPAVGSEPSARAKGLPPAPLTARDILQRGTTLGLTRGQVAKLEALSREWSGEAAELEAALEAAGEELTRFMQGAQGAGGTSLQEIQRRSAGFRERSADLAEQRRVHAAAAARVLTSAQRERLAETMASKTRGGDQ